MTPTEKTADQRNRDVERVNVAAAKYAVALARVHRARSEYGTATSLLAKAAEEYSAAAEDLVAGLPDLPDVRAELDRIRELGRVGHELRAVGEDLVDVDAAPPGEPS